MPANSIYVCKKDIVGTDKIPSDNSGLTKAMDVASVAVNKRYKGTIIRKQISNDVKSAHLARNVARIKNKF